jgi:plasmid stabilization system protein ParE
MATYGFHPEALAEYHDAASYLLERTSPLIAAAFIAEVETAISRVLVNPETWRVVETPNIRRYLLNRFPYALYYRWETERNRVAVYAVMHLQRQPGYWRRRLL